MAYIQAVPSKGKLHRSCPTHTHDRAHWQYAILVATLLWQGRVHYLESTRVGHPTCTNSTTIVVKELVELTA